MRNLLILCTAFPLWTPVVAAEEGSLFYSLELTLTRSELDNLTLGNEPREDRLDIEEYEIAFSLEYQATEQLYYFFGGSLIDEHEDIEPDGEREEVSGFERGEMGIGYSFGKAFESEFKIGRNEFVSTSDWWYWWDEELDSISLASRYDEFEVLVAVAEEQGPENSDQDFIDPEIEDLRRILLSFDWEFAEGQLLQFYYLDQDDRSSPYSDMQSVRVDKIDESDADLTWQGINYLGWFEFDNIGELEIEIAYAEVSGRETLYEFDDPANGRADLDETTRQRVDGSAHGLLLRFEPKAIDGLRIVLGRARSSGDRSEDDGKDNAFRQTGLQGDSEVFGELYQPELSNLVVETIGLEYKFTRNIKLGLFRHEYRQDELASEMRDVAIDADTGGTSRSLGEEIDLVLTLDIRDFEIEITAAEFKAGKAYDHEDPSEPQLEGEKSRYWQVELNYRF